MAESRQGKPETTPDFKPSPQATRDITSLLGPGTDRR
jgi:hypothetical protein